MNWYSPALLAIILSLLCLVLPFRPAATEKYRHDVSTEFGLASVITSCSPLNLSHLHHF